MVIITLKIILNEKVGYHFRQVTVVQSGWDQRGHGLPRNKLAQIFSGAMYQFSAVTK